MYTYIIYIYDIIYIYPRISKPFAFQFTKLFSSFISHKKPQDIEARGHAARRVQQRNPAAERAGRGAEGRDMT